jgi:hypothetical protein
MKIIEMNIVEFYNFKQLAKLYNLMFMCTILHGQIFVEADIRTLEQLGY